MWDPDQYLRFETERRRPVEDLLARVPTEPVHQVVDLGCGPGQLTEMLRRQWPDASITGVDRDESMLTRARATPSPDGVRYVQADIGEWEPSSPVDVVFSNAALHWLPDHRDRLPGLLDWLRPGGTLAVQIPGNTTAPSHQVVADLRRTPRWRTRLGAGATEHVAVSAPVDYATALAGVGIDVDVWETTYIHLLEGPDPVTAWLMGSTLRPVLALLDRHEAQTFLEELERDLARHYPPAPDGRTPFAFRRLFIVARRSGGAGRSAATTPG